jgi:hypothetical protein
VQDFVAIINGVVYLHRCLGDWLADAAFAAFAHQTDNEDDTQGAEVQGSSLASLHEAYGKACLAHCARLTSGLCKVFISGLKQYGAKVCVFTSWALIKLGWNGGCYDIIA